MLVPLLGDYTLRSEFFATDAAAFVQHLGDPLVVANTLTIPSPYREEDAQWWMDEVRRIRERLRRPMHFALRAPNGTLAGAVGFSHYDPNYAHRLNLGFWLGREHRGRGVMAAAVRAACSIAVGEIGVARVGALVFCHNDRSMRVLERCGFVFEGILRRFEAKGGTLMDVKSFAYLAP